ncbi:hypothetical protein [Gallibacterium anatis]|uniref:Uncharacterized protein n=1 Tax=Gallibacterium anatis TaxID=750 RepID=A0A0A2XLM1_9PAST|nr:hypothetical protein [Gallibacterium anatis]KGQ33206.1 hypothetical protein JP32_03115 [Gallibacterium anatis]
MLKRLIPLCVITLISNNAFSDENLFFCETENGKKIYLSKDNEFFTYKAINAKTGEKELIFKNRIEDVREITPEDYQYTGRSLNYSYEVKNGSYSYVLTTSTDRITLENSSYITILKNGKDIKELICKNNRNKEESINFDTKNEEEIIYQEGTYKVGIDIPEGEYKLIETDSDFGGFYRVYLNSGDKLGSIVTGGSFKRMTYVTVKKGQYLELSRCNAEKVN